MKFRKIIRANDFRALADFKKTNLGIVLSCSSDAIIPLAGNGSCRADKPGTMLQEESAHCSDTSGVA